MSDTNKRETGVSTPQPKQNPDARDGKGSPATEKTSGSGPAIAERSKDARTTKPGRQPGAYVKR